MILGMDISTSCTGFCVLNDEGEPVHLTHIDLVKIENFFDKAKAVKLKIFEIMMSYPIDSIAVEDYLTSFSRGKSSSGVLFKLAKFNGIIQWICYSDFEKPAFPINVSNARKMNNIVVLSKNKSEEHTKAQVLRQVKEIIGDKFIFPTKILKSGDRKGVEVIEKYSYDMADAFVIAKAMWIVKCENKE